MLSLVPGLPGNYLRGAFYRLSLMKFSDDSCVEFGTVLSQRSIEMGRGVYVGLRCSIGECRIEDDVVIGSNVDIISGTKQHFFDSMTIPIREQGGVLEKIVIGEDSWLGNGSIITANVGKKSVIGAGSVVVHDIEPFSVAVGNPARTIKKRQ